MSDNVHTLLIEMETCASFFSIIAKFANSYIYTCSSIKDVYRKCDSYRYVYETCICAKELALKRTTLKLHCNSVSNIPLMSSTRT